MTAVATVPFQQAGVTFDPAAHRYFYDGAPVLNVTSILRTHHISADWSHVPEATLLQKRDIGTAAHQAAHYYDEGDLQAATVDPRVRPYLDGWVRFVDENEFEPLLLETSLVHPLKRYGGMVDRFGLVHKLSPLPCVVDLKTGDPDDAGAGPQTAAYEQLIRAVLPDLYAWLMTYDPLLTYVPLDAMPWTLAELQAEPWPRYSVQLLPTGRYKLCTYTQQRDFDRFNWALALEASAHPSWCEARP